jgi:hypothetical protein
MEYIDKTFSENTGGGVICDFVILKNGQCIGISNECISLYDSFDSFFESNGGEPTIYLSPMIEREGKTFSS